MKNHFRLDLSPKAEKQQSLLHLRVNERYHSVIKKFSEGLERWLGRDGQCCYSRRPGFDPQHPCGNSELCLQFLGTQCPLLASGEPDPHMTHRHPLRCLRQCDMTSAVISFLELRGGRDRRILWFIGPPANLC